VAALELLDPELRPGVLGRAGVDADVPCDVPETDARTPIACPVNDDRRDERPALFLLEDVDLTEERGERRAVGLSSIPAALISRHRSPYVVVAWSWATRWRRRASQSRLVNHSPAE